MLNYQPVSKSFNIPSEYQLIDTLPDGRLLLVGSSKLLIEESPGNRNFNPVDAPDFGAPSFLKLSPSGQKVAFGNYGSQIVGFFAFPYKLGDPIQSFSVSPYDAEWVDEDLLVVSGLGGDKPQVSMIDTANSVTKTLIKGIPGASAGVTIDKDKNLYTGLGSGSDGAVGLVKAFQYAHWSAVFSEQTVEPLDFVGEGQAVANLLSAASLNFDNRGNLMIGGGRGIDDAGNEDLGYAGVVSASAIRSALFDGNVIEPTTATERFEFQRLDPTPNSTDPNEYWFILSNSVQDEIYLRKFSEDSILVYQQKLDEKSIDPKVQLGDNDGYYSGYNFVGMRYREKIEIVNPDGFTGDPVLRLSTKYVETRGYEHKVTLGGLEIGTITDGDVSSEQEIFDFRIVRGDYEKLFAVGNEAELVIEVANPGAGLADDFVIERISTVTIPV